MCISKASCFAPLLGCFPLRSAGCGEMDSAILSAYEVRHTMKQIIQLA